MGTVVGSLVDRGYGLAWRVLDAQHHGVPQRRRRIVLVGHRGAPGMHLQRYFLTPRAAAGILRRSERRSRPIPEKLRAALLRVSQQQ